MPDPITFQGQLWRISQDHEGETKVTFCFSLSELQKVLKLGESAVLHLLRQRPHTTSEIIQAPCRSC